jgi:NitT/TauT family transport system substrate-binding protein
MVDKGYATNYDYALQAMHDVPYNRWRVYNPEETIRFYALALHGVGMVKSTPDEIIKRGTDWRFLKELKMEMPVLPTPEATSS